MDRTSYRSGDLNMTGFWDVVTWLFLIAFLYSLISILKPLPPYRGRGIAMFGAIVALFLVGAIANEVHEAEKQANIAAIDAEKAAKRAEREALQKNDPERYAALLAEEAEREKKAAEALKIALAAERERHAKQARSAEVNWDEPDWADRIKKVDRHIEAVVLFDQQEGPLKGDLVRVTYYNPSPWSETTLLFGASDAYLRAAQAVLEHKPTASGIQFIVKADAVDEYKRTETVFAFVFALPRVEMNKIVWDKMTGADMLNLSSVDRKSIGRSIARAYCEDRAQYARRFCQTAAR